MLLRTLPRYLPPILLGLVTTAILLLHAGGLLPLHAIERVEAYAYDTRLRLTAPDSINQRVVIIDLDEKSLAAEGRWPWRRDKVARLVDRLFDDYAVAVLGVDVVFGEPDDSSGIALLDTLGATPLGRDRIFIEQSERLRPALDRDGIFSTAVAGRKIVLGYYVSINDDATRIQTSGALPDPVFMAETFSGKNMHLPLANGYGANLPELQHAAWSGGHFNPLYDHDGVNRRIPLLIQYHDAIYESLSLAVARAALGDPPLRPIFAGDDRDGYSALEWLKVAGHQIPVDVNAAMMVPYRRTEKRFPYYSATDVLNLRVSRGRWQARLCYWEPAPPGLPITG